jgi:hypothetical protein
MHPYRLGSDAVKGVFTSADGVRSIKKYQFTSQVEKFSLLANGYANSYSIGLFTLILRLNYWNGLG